MKIRLHRGLCSGHARCAAVAPELYTIDEESGFTDLGDLTDVPPGMEAFARRGARACPERALEILEDTEQK